MDELAGARIADVCSAAPTSGHPAHGGAEAFKAGLRALLAAPSR